jgi:hypothetical protein
MIKLQLINAAMRPEGKLVCQISRNYERVSVATNCVFSCTVMLANILGHKFVYIKGKRYGLNKTA